MRNRIVVCFGLRRSEGARALQAVRGCERRLWVALHVRWQVRAAPCGPPQLSRHALSSGWEDVRTAVGVAVGRPTGTLAHDQSPEVAAQEGRTGLLEGLPVWRTLGVDQLQMRRHTFTTDIVAIALSYARRGKNTGLLWPVCPCARVCDFLPCRGSRLCQNVLAFGLCLQALAIRTTVHVRDGRSHRHEVIAPV